MRVLVVVALLPALEGCDRWAGCDDRAAWALPLFRSGTTNEGADANARVGPDGTITVAIADPFTEVRFAGVRFTGPHVARVSAQGTDVLVRGAGTTAPYGKVIGIDDRGNSFVVFGSFQDGRLVAFSAGLDILWDRVLGGITLDLASDVAADGQVSYAIRDAGGTVGGLVLLERNGALRWSVDLGGRYAARVRFADNGDIQVAGGGTGGSRRWRFAAADGAIIEDEPAPGGPSLLYPDGSTILSLFDESGRQVIERWDPANSLVWRRTLDGAGSTAAPTLATNGDLLVPLYGDELSVARIDADTGEELPRMPLCAPVTLVGGDDDGVVTLGMIGSPSIGLARFDE